MKPPIFVRTLTEAEREQLEAGLRSSDAFVLRRCQILLASARGQHATAIRQNLSCDDETVRKVIKAFNARGLKALEAGSRRPHHTQAAFSKPEAERLKAMLHKSPRTYGKETRVWTLELVAEVSLAEGLTRERVSDETIRATLERLGIRWKRAKQWDHQPGSRIPAKKRLRDRLIALASRHPDWALGFQDETWWSRFTQPHLHAWSPDGCALRLVEQVPAKTDRTPKALACYGLLLRHCPVQADHWQAELWLRFVEDRPLSAITTQFLDWCCGKLQAMGKRVLILIWDNARWHISRVVRAWIQAHNRQVRETGQGTRIFVCPLPTKSPWLNPIEPKWVHGKRRIAEPDRTLSALEVEQRVCAALDCSTETHLSVSENVP